MGGALDVGMIGVLSYAMYQASVENLRAAGASSVITDLNSTGLRPLTGVQIASNISDMFLTKVYILEQDRYRHLAPKWIVLFILFLFKNVTEWESNMKSIDMPDYFITFAAIVSSALTLSYPDFVVEMVAVPLFDGFNVDQEIRDFILNEYLPEVKGLFMPH